MLSGCQTDYFNRDKEPSCPASTYVSQQPISRVSAELDELEKEQILDAIHHHQPTLAYVMEKCEQAGIPQSVALLPLLSSRYHNGSHQDDEKGIWSLSPTMAQNLSLTHDYWFDARLDVEQSTDAVIAYMQYLHSQLNDWDLALTAYQVGLQDVLDAVNTNKHQNLATDLQSLALDDESKQSIAKLNAIDELLQNLPKQASSLKSVAFPGQIDLESLVTVTGIPREELRALNGGFKRNLTSPNGPHRILVREDAYKALKSVTQDPSKLRHVAKSNYNYHAVRKNESLSVIAHRYETSVNEIKRANSLKNDVIHVNQKLLIPENKQQPQIKEPSQNNHPGPKRVLHVVHKNESLYHISKQYHVSLTDIAKWNQLDGLSIKPNQTITIWQYTPVDTAHFYTVRPNDSLAKIAREHKTSIKSLKDANLLTTNVIHPGDRLAIPANKTK